MLTTIIAAVVVLGGLIFFHELGHFLVARALGMGVSTFSLGFGPKLLTWKHGKTEYALSLVPLGGYVALVGEYDGTDGNKGELPDGFTHEESFSGRPAWQRLLVVAAGPVFNIILAWLLCWIMAYGWGLGLLLPHVGKVEANSPAAVAGLQPGDTILRVNGVPVGEWKDMADAINNSGGKPLQLMVSRPRTAQEESIGVTNMSGVVSKDARLVHLSVTPRLSVRKTIFGEEEKAWLVGITASGNVRRVDLGFFEAAREGMLQTGRLLDLTWQSFVKLAQRVIPADQVGGPIMIAQMVGQQAEQGLVGLLGLAALISINLGVLNLLPVPVLDGGQILFFLLEIIFRRPVPLLIQTWAMRVGVALLAMLMIFATYNDIMRLLRGWGVLGGGA